MSVFFNVLEFLHSEDQIFLHHTGWFTLDRILAGFHDFLLVVVELNTLVHDTSDPVDVEGDLGVPAGNTSSTADTARHDADESCPVLVVWVLGLQGPTTVSLAGSTEYSLLVLLPLGAEHTVVETVGKMCGALFPHCFLQSCVVSQHLYTVLVRDDGHIGLQQSSRGSILCLAISLDCGNVSIINILPGVLVQTGGAVPVLR